MSQFKQRTNNNGSKAEGTKASTLHIADLAPDLTPGTAEADDAEREIHNQGQRRSAGLMGLTRAVPRESLRNRHIPETAFPCDSQKAPFARSSRIFDGQRHDGSLLR
jgi:hypothetical protein